jgi:hypothetical protein
MPALHGQTARPLDYEVKAVYLLNFGRFATWPASASGGTNPFAVCVLGRDPFGQTLDSAVSGETVDGKRVVAKRIATSEDAGDCRILFVGASEKGQLAGILDAATRAGTLTVSDMASFVEQGGMIQFVADNNKVRFAVNVEAAERAGLRLSSELLRLAVTIKAGSKPGT